MASLGTTLLSVLENVERPGSFCTGEVSDIAMPVIDVDGVGRLAFPVMPDQALRLIAVAGAAPYGKGEQTLLDPRVRKTWQIGPDKVVMGGRRWPETLARLAERAASGLGVEGQVTAEFYKLLIYDPGSFFVGHRDTERNPWYVRDHGAYSAVSAHRWRTGGPSPRPGSRAGPPTGGTFGDRFRGVLRRLRARSPTRYLRLPRRAGFQSVLPRPQAAAAGTRLPPGTEAANHCFATLGNGN